MKNKFKRVLAGIVTFAVLSVTAAVPAFAADKTDTGTGSVTPEPKIYSVKIRL